ncbi:hypothetical protein K501DRAFT_270474 [Backusella circina FSU 941]|nr:hypothetical protein K501DRAFT_270474 [Backusella circina FSU 941]
MKMQNILIPTLRFSTSRGYQSKEPTMSKLGESSAFIDSHTVTKCLSRFYAPHAKLLDSVIHPGGGVISTAEFKIDLRSINDKIKQRYNIKHDMAVKEEDAGDSKFVSDRCKISIENKGIIGNRFVRWCLNKLSKFVTNIWPYCLSTHPGKNPD